MTGSLLLAGKPRANPIAYDSVALTPACSTGVRPSADRDQQEDAPEPDLEAPMSWTKRWLYGSKVATASKNDSGADHRPHPGGEDETPPITPMARGNRWAPGLE